MRYVRLFCVIFLTGLLSCTESEPDSPATTPYQEIVHSISEYDVEYQNRARAVAEEMMSHWPEESYVRWRPVRIEPSEVLQDEILSDSAMPELLQLTLYPDTIVSAQKTRYKYMEETGGAIWEGVIPGFELSRVEIGIVTATGDTAFVIRIWDSPKHYYILATDYPDVYVALEGRVKPSASLD